MAGGKLGEVDRTVIAAMGSHSASDVAGNSGYIHHHGYAPRKGLPDDDSGALGAKVRSAEAVRVEMVTEQGEAFMLTEDNKVRVNRLVDAIWNKGDLAAVDELYAPNVVDHNPATGQALGVEGQRQGVTAFRSAFPDLRTTNDDLVAEGDRVVLRWSGRGTQTGALFGVPPTGRQAGFTGIEIYRLEGGKVIERWGEFDVFGILQQLGAIPAPG